ncbi:hypothetical protein Nepgr_022453 [Nepenthes gracilis]|uniref:Uncharacterized protein n=1 Tax=Nepenthes gracilis TaxID=150966 RepID=A0AAD3T246_NEPGR|nr:hypothetical protein Nepgr_022453 [Nepenthes gracilis]
MRCEKGNASRVEANGADCVLKFEFRERLCRREGGREKMTAVGLESNGGRIGFGGKELATVGLETNPTVENESL